MSVLSFTVPGAPVAKPRMTHRDKWLKRPCVARYWEWCDRARVALLQTGLKLPPADRVTSLAMVAYFEPPPRKKREAVPGTFHRCKPDADNLLKAADCLYPNDDSAIPRVSCEKLWGTPPRLEVTIEFE